MLGRPRQRGVQLASRNTQSPPNSAPPGQFYAVPTTPTTPCTAHPPPHENSRHQRQRFPSIPRSLVCLAAEIHSHRGAAHSSLRRMVFHHVGPQRNRALPPNPGLLIDLFLSPGSRGRQRVPSAPAIAYIHVLRFQLKCDYTASAFLSMPHGGWGGQAPNVPPDLALRVLSNTRVVHGRCSESARTTRNGSSCWICGEEFVLIFRRMRFYCREYEGLHRVLVPVKSTRKFYRSFN
ncbi:hypothetical protein C8R44DRAFT_384337 [Mycena epipterygia]|nr:hypothetical protein C8R44DRAFT_384337 [Mycena epipterygia]